MGEIGFLGASIAQMIGVCHLIDGLPPRQSRLLCPWTLDLLCLLMLIRGFGCTFMSGILTSVSVPQARSGHNVAHHHQYVNVLMIVF